MEKKEQEIKHLNKFHEIINWERKLEYQKENRSRRGFQRKIIFLIDMSIAMKKIDYKPDKITFVKTKLKSFLDDFYSNNQRLKYKENRI